MTSLTIPENSLADSTMFSSFEEAELRLAFSKEEICPCMTSNLDKINCSGSDKGGTVVQPVHSVVPTLPVAGVEEELVSSIPNKES